MSRFISGQTVVLPHAGAFATVITADEFSVKVAPPGGGFVSRYESHQVKTRATALRHWHRMLTDVANQLGDLELMDACEQMAVYVERAAQNADTADAATTLSGGAA